MKLKGNKKTTTTTQSSLYRQSHQDQFLSVGVRDCPSPRDVYGATTLKADSTQESVAQLGLVFVTAEKGFGKRPS